MDTHRARHPSGPELRDETTRGCVLNTIEGGGVPCRLIVPSAGLVTVKHLDTTGGARQWCQSGSKEGETDICKKCAGRAPLVTANSASSRPHAYHTTHQQADSTQRNEGTRAAL